MEVAHGLLSADARRTTRQWNWCVMRCSPEQLHSAITRAIHRHKQSARIWEESGGSYARWTKHIGKLIGDTLATYARLKPVHRGRPDPEGYSEYLNIDVMGLENPWGPPVAVCELENKYEVQWPKYSLWKLLSTSAEFRLLVGYFNPRARKYPTDANSLARLLAQEVGAQFEAVRPAPTAFLSLADWHGDKWRPEHFLVRGSEATRL